MIKKSLYVLLSITLVFVLIGCKKDETIINSSDLAISDPEIKKEIEFMREKKIISESLYQKWLTSSKSQIINEVDVLINTSGDSRYDEYYRIAPVDDGSLKSGMMYDEQLLNRIQVQEMMQKENYGMNLAISDPQIKKEIEFMLSEKMIDDATYNKWQTLSRDQLIFTGGLPKTLSTGIVEKSEQYLYNYPDCPNCSDGVVIERRDVQKMMEGKGI